MTAARRFVMLAALVAAFVFLAPVIANEARSHEPYSGKTDPVTKGGCCGGSDCAALDVVPGMLLPHEDGYRLVMTAAQAAKINPYRTTPVDTVIPWNRIQPSWDGQFRICLPSARNASMQADFYCFWDPPNS